jgi:integrase/recombinase XerC
MRTGTAPEILTPDIAPSNLAHLRAFDASLAGRSAHTRAAYLRDARVLAVLAGATDLGGLGARELRRMLATLHGRGLSGRSLARMLSSWRALYRVLLDRDANARENPCAGIKAPKAVKKLPSALSPDEAVRLVQIPGDDPLAVRDRALFELAYSSGLRLSELAGLDVDRIDLATGEVRVWGKGAKERIVPVGTAAIAAMRAWLPVRAGMREADANALFVGRSGKRNGRCGRGSRGTSIRTCCGIRSRRTCCNRRGICARCRRCSDTPASRARRSTRTSISSISPRRTTRRTQERNAGSAEQLRESRGARRRAAPARECSAAGLHVAPARASKGAPARPLSWHCFLGRR